MAQFLVTRKIEIDAAHRVPDHASKCQHVHGHRYTIEATCSGQLFDNGPQRGMVLDFGFLKDLMVSVIHDLCDHAMIAWRNDPLLSAFRECCGKLHIMPYTPTAENLARYWYDLLAPEVARASQGNAQLVSLRIYETPNCWADYPYVR